MGIDTKVLLTQPPTLLELLEYAEETYGHASLSRASSFYWLSFKDGKDARQLAVFPPGECASDYADVHTGPAILISMGCWGNSEAIGRRLAVKFGGMIQPNDSKDDWQNVSALASHGGQHD